MQHQMVHVRIVLFFCSILPQFHWNLSIICCYILDLDKDFLPCSISKEDAMLPKLKVSIVFVKLKWRMPSQAMYLSGNILRIIHCIMYISDVKEYRYFIPFLKLLRHELLCFGSYVNRGAMPCSALSDDLIKQAHVFRKIKLGK